MTPILTIDRRAIAQNYTCLKHLARGAEVAGVVKANAYGLGVEVVVPTLLEQGAGTFFVAHASEGVQVKKLAPDADVYVLNGYTNAKDLAELRAEGLLPIINGDQALAAFDGGHAALHIDTGMRRLGLDDGEADRFVAAPTPIKDLLLMTHLASADDPMMDGGQTAEQAARFAKLIDQIKPARASFNNSAGTLLSDLPRYDMVRPGIALMGCPPRDTDGTFAPVITLTAPVIQLRDIAAWEPVGYNATWTATRPSRIATVPVGYADGFLRSQSGTAADVAFNGQRLPIVGRVSMDLITIDVTDVRDPLTLGDHLELIGPTIPVEEVAARAGTIPFEVFTSLGKRYERRII